MQQMPNGNQALPNFLSSLCIERRDQGEEIYQALSRHIDLKRVPIILDIVELTNRFEERGMPCGEQFAVYATDMILKKTELAPGQPVVRIEPDPCVGLGGPVDVLQRLFSLGLFHEGVALFHPAPTRDGEEKPFAALGIRRTPTGEYVFFLPQDTKCHYMVGGPVDIAQIFKACNLSQEVFAISFIPTS
jgi:hypothetical protein